MNNENTIKLVRDVGIPGALLAFLLFSYVKLTYLIIPLLQTHNDELHDLITLTKQILELLRSQGL